VRRWQIVVALPLLLIAGACPNIPVPAANPGVWIVEVAGEGGYWLPPEILRSLDVDPQADSPPALCLSWSDQVVGHLPLRTDEGWGVFFFAADRSMRYTRRTTFRLEVDKPGETMAAAEPPTAAGPSGSGLFTQHWEEDLRYLPQADTGIPWVWERLYTPDAVTHTLTLPDALPGPITVTLHVWSHTASPANPDHLLRLKWDGQTVGEWEWDGQGMQRLIASWDEARPEGEHTLEIETPTPPNVRVAMVWVDGWDTAYRRRVRADGNIWQAEGGALQVEDVSEGSRLLDVTDPLAPRDLGAIPTDGAAGAVLGHRYWVGDPTQAPEPLTVRAARKLDTDVLADVTYLALAPLDFHAPLQPLLEHRRSQGLKAEVVDIQAVYDTFGTGQPDPQAVRALVQRLPTLRYLLAVGDGTAEIDGYDGEAGALRVVVPLTRTAVLGETPADVLLGTNGEGRPVVAVGRFPATSAREVSTMVKKTIQWESDESPPTALILSDDEPGFASISADIVDLLPEGVAIQRVDAGDEWSRAQALETLRQGPTWVNYTGHGSLTILCNEGTLKLEDGKTWREPAVMVAWTCLAAHFIHPEQASIGEAWMRAPQGGVAAFLGPVGETTTSEQLPFTMAFYTALREEERLGDAWLAALQKGNSQDVTWGYTVLGDPALRLRWECPVKSKDNRTERAWFPQKIIAPRGTCSVK
jgi:hypothetical protein